MLTKNRIKQLEELETKIGISFKNKNLLNQALTHSSFSYNEPNNNQNNERLEFFGDAVLKLAVSEYLLKRFPHYQEGDLTKIRAIIISDAMLAKKASQLELGNFILFGNNELKTGGNNKDSNLANALEAIFGAYYFDQNNKHYSNKFVITLLMDIIQEAIKPSTIIDAKSVLQEYAQKNRSNLPQYEVISEKGPDHDKMFEIKATLVIKNKIYQDNATGKTKKEAEQSSARKILEKINKK